MPCERARPRPKKRMWPVGFISIYPRFPPLATSPPFFLSLSFPIPSPTPGTPAAAPRRLRRLPPQLSGSPDAGYSTSNRIPSFPAPTRPPPPSCQKVIPSMRRAWRRDGPGCGRSPAVLRLTNEREAILSSRQRTRPDQTKLRILCSTLLIRWKFREKAASNGNGP